MGSRIGGSSTLLDQDLISDDGAVAQRLDDDSPGGEGAVGLEDPW